MPVEKPRKTSSYAKGIREARRLAGLGQRELSSLSGFDPSYLSHVESGRKMPSVPAFEAIARALGMSPLLLFFLSYEGDPKPPVEKVKKALLHNWASGRDRKGV